MTVWGKFAEYPEHHIRMQSLKYTTRQTHILRAEPMNRRKKNNRQAGQVLITGVIMLIALLLMLLSIFDVHNLIRAKFKFETAQQSAALAGARWQKESLNLIGGRRKKLGYSPSAV